MHNNDIFIADKEIIDRVIKEMQSGNSKFGGFNSTHEFYAVLKEEVDEVWDDIKKNDIHFLEEVLQVAAVALRALHQYKYGRNK